MTKMKIQQNNINELIKLTQQHPCLKIVPMVNGELDGDDFAYWMGNWSKAEIDEIYHIDERIYFKSIDEDELIERRADLVFCEEYPNHKYLNDEESETVTKTATVYVRDLDWEKVITVKIELPY